MSKEKLDLQELLVQLVPMVQLVIMDCEVKQGQLDHRVKKEFRVQPAIQEYKAPLVIQEEEVIQVIRVLRAKLATQVQKVPQEKLVLRAKLATQVQMVLEENRD